MSLAATFRPLLACALLATTDARALEPDCAHRGLSTRLGLGGAAGIGVGHGYPSGSPALSVGLAGTTRACAASYSVAIESQPTFFYSVDAHYDFMLWPIVVLAAGAQRNFEQTSLGFNAWFGLASLGGGPYARFLLRERPRSLQHLEVRLWWLPAQNVATTVLYSLSLLPRRKVTPPSAAAAPTRPP